MRGKNYEYVPGFHLSEVINLANKSGELAH
jgi:hypothetical protein